jgi:hypothetical protein
VTAWVRQWPPARLCLLAALVVSLAGCSLVEELLPDHGAVSIEPQVAVLEVGSRLRFVALVGKGSFTQSVTWSSSNPEIVVIDASGFATALEPGGPIQITAKYGSAFVSSQIVIVPRTDCPDDWAGSSGRGSAVQDLGSRSGLSVRIHSFEVPAAPPNPTVWDWGPDTFWNRYAPPRDVFPVQCGNNLALVWQAPATGQIYFTRIARDLLSYDTEPLVLSSELLIAAAYGDSNVFLVTRERVDTRQERPLGITLHAIGRGARHGVEKRSVLDTSRSGLDVVARPVHNAEGHASLTYETGRLALMLARTYHVAGDGLNHQGGLAAIFDADTLAMTRFIRQTSGHSFQNVLVANSRRGFLAIDMADNFPRGIHLHSFDESEWRRQVVYTFKTRHGTTPQNPAGKSFPLYEELSNSDESFYRWSNDNNTYSELGAVIETEAGITVLFVGEPDADGRALRNEHALDYLHDARNIAVVTVRPTFGIAPGSAANVVPADIVLTEGPPEEGGFYTFVGGWAPQRNVGVRWLTRGTDADADNASRLKAVALGSEIVLLWERWTRSRYVDTQMMVIDALGDIIVPQMTVGSLDWSGRLQRSADAVVFDGQMVVAAGDASLNVLNLLVVERGLP